MINKKNAFLIATASFLFHSCTEPYNIETNTLENHLVVEAIITDEYKQQEIKITNTFAFEEYYPENVENAIVYIKDNNNNSYPFTYNTEKQTYLSNDEFSAI